MRPQRTDSELQTGAEGVMYEVEMLYNVAILTNSPLRSNELINNMYIETFLVHFRNVRDFLFESPLAQVDDVLAVDFTSKWSGRTWKEIVDGEQKRINKQLSHISYTRFSFSKEWPVPNMANPLLEKFEEFLSELSVENRAVFARLKPIFPRVYS